MPSPPNKAGVSIAKASKVCWRYNCYNRHSEPWDVKGGGWYRQYQAYYSQVIMYKHIITWIALFRKIGCQIWRDMGGWLTLRQRLWSNHRFLCHNSTILMWLLRRSGRICDGQTHLIIFLLVFLITFNWIRMKPHSFVMGGLSLLSITFSSPP